MKNAIVLWSVLLLLWIAGSAYVYVCKVRKACDSEVAGELANDKLLAGDSSAAGSDAVAGEGLENVEELGAGAVPVAGETALPVAEEMAAPGVHKLYFDFNKGVSVISNEDRAYFNSLNEYLTEFSDKRVSVVGHSDNKGPEWAKEKYGELRAQFVKGKLIEAGVASEAIDAYGESDRKPAADNSSEEGQAKNRRTEISIK
ncbi:MAG: OmpA family protein [Bacteroidales bacterium]|jgi:outer membrane protein OmpA-like peptidoglycan-associated protein|nr:OmpA family protein [Bacteroidales bacterium]